MIPHVRALVIVRSNNKARWLRPVVVDRIRAKQAENVQAMHRVQRAANRASTAELLALMFEEGD